MPVALNGEKLSAKEIILKLNELGGKNGIGLLDIVENRLVGMKCRGVYETPGGTILYKAHSVLESICLDKMTLHEKQKLAITFGELVYNGQWFTPLREALSAFVDKTQERVTGTVKLKLYKGNMINAGVWSPYSLYSEDIATFGESDYNQADAAGFINLYGLPIKVQALVERRESFKQIRKTGITEEDGMAKLWAGVTAGITDPVADDFNSSLRFDSRMYRQDIRGSMAHAAMLGARGILTADEAETLCGGLADILEELEAGTLAIDPGCEDIHSFVEQELTKRLGEVGKKLHTARSRNDQVALDLRMYLRGECCEIRSLLDALLETLTSLAAEHKASIMPGYTHLQRAQPVTFGHYLMAYAMMLLRDLERLDDGAAHERLAHRLLRPGRDHL